MANGSSNSEKPKDMHICVKEVSVKNSIREAPIHVFILMSRVLPGP